MSREGGNVGVVPGTACEGVQNRPPRTKSPSRYQSTLRRGEVAITPSGCRFARLRRLGEPVVGLFLTALEGVYVSGGRVCLWRVEMSREGGNVGVVPVVACQGVQNRPPRTKSPSRYRNTLRRGERRQKHPPRPSRVGGENRLVFKIDGEVLRIVQCGTHYGDF